MPSDTTRDLATGSTVSYAFTEMGSFGEGFPRSVDWSRREREEKNIMRYTLQTLLNHLLVKAALICCVDKIEENIILKLSATKESY